MINNKIINDQIVINNEINYLDLFSGIGGFAKGIEQLNKTKTIKAIFSIE